MRVWGIGKIIQLTPDASQVAMWWQRLTGSLVYLQIVPLLELEFISGYRIINEGKQCFPYDWTIKREPLSSTNNSTEHSHGLKIKEFVYLPAFTRGNELEKVWFRFKQRQPNSLQCNSSDLTKDEFGPGSLSSQETVSWVWSFCAMVRLLLGLYKGSFAIPWTRDQ